MEHSAQELGKCPKLLDQYPMRRDVILSTLEERGISLGSLSAVAARGGTFGKVEGGGYRIDEKLTADCREPLTQHPSNLAALIGYDLEQQLGIPSYMVWRQPFPGPGLAIRIIGEITKEKLDILREADFIFRDEIAKAGLEREIWQYFAVLTNMRSVGVMGDERTYDYTLALRAVNSVDAMTADWAKIPYDVLEKASNRIINEVKHINRIVYDITSKPPATIEWE